jgi:type IV pilus assembly protein PilY1
MKRIAELKRISFAGLIALLLAASAAELALSDGPLFIELGVGPNVVLTLDDSGSMGNCRVTDKGLDKDALVDRDGDYGPLETAYLGAAAPALNKLAYDPNIEYVIPVEVDGSPVFTPSFTNAPDDGYKAAGYNDASTSYYDLSTSWRPCRSRTSWYDPFAPPDDGPGKPAYYTIFTGSDWKNESQVIDNSNYTIITVGSAADVGGFGTSAAEKQQNFANWFSFYRYRYLTMKTVAARAFAHPDLDNRVRLAYSLMWGDLGYCSTTGWPGDCNGGNSGIRDVDDTTPGEGGYANRAGPISLMKQFEGANRAAFFQWIFHSQIEGGTPLMMATERAGEFYRDKYPVRDTSVTLGQKEIRWEPMDAVDSPWSFDPGVTRDPVFSCRQAFFVLMTDGGWDCDEPASCGIAGNVDNQSWTYPEALPSGATDYTPFAPYKDNNDETFAGGTWGYLADNAFYYWVNDLQPTLANDVPAFMPDPTPHPVTNEVEDNPANDPATWQHMVTFTVGFGVDGSIPQTPANYQDLLKGASNGGIDWSSNTIDDLWHAGINGRGQFMNAKSSQELVNAFATALTDVLARSASGGSVALNSGSLDANSRLYQARFQSGSWFGQLLAFDLNATTGAVVTPEAWDAGPLLNTQVAGGGWDTAREVITFDGTDGIPFRWGSLAGGMQSDLNNSTPGVKPGNGQPRRCSSAIRSSIIPMAWRARRTRASKRATAGARGWSMWAAMTACCTALMPAPGPRRSPMCRSKYFRTCR